MTECSCDMIPVYIMAILGGLLFGIFINQIGPTAGYYLSEFNYDIYNMIDQPMNFLSNPVFYVSIFLIGVWQRERIINIPFWIYYSLRDMTSFEIQPRQSEKHE